MGINPALQTWRNVSDVGACPWKNR